MGNAPYRAVLVLELPTNKQALAPVPRVRDVERVKRRRLDPDHFVPGARMARYDPEPRRLRRVERKSRHRQRKVEDDGVARGDGAVVHHHGGVMEGDLDGLGATVSKKDYTPNFVLEFG